MQAVRGSRLQAGEFPHYPRFRRLARIRLCRGRLGGHRQPFAGQMSTRLSPESGLLFPGPAALAWPVHWPGQWHRRWLRPPWRAMPDR